MADEKLTQLADPASALASYLDDLLHTATDTALREETSQTAVQPVREAPKLRVVETPPPEPESRVAESLDEPVAEVAEPVITEAPVPSARRRQVDDHDSASQPPAAPPSRPDWSEAPFECLIFTVAGLQLAVPLVLLGAIHRIESEIRPIPGSPRWYMGIRPDRDHNLRVVDSAEWIMAGRVPENARDNYRFVIRLDNSEWGLACDDVAQSFTLSPDEVRWRSARSKRPWLAGTVINHMCALIDVRAMADLLVRAERERHLDLS
ncbi:chemotaxis protein CheW [Marinobacter salinisoli]|uniref:Chemotaxis protein CheW n=1 Tax=Marinobacter salinisoli TaxID=2769486 RepID=A0ABX7MSK7_9GAMM|nr:CheW domain-containing protein [Marinobacter salinisoli]QSP94379.1 chemotaxis protein CheW [Marinobacter salinisoli]